MAKKKAKKVAKKVSKKSASKKASKKISKKKVAKSAPKKVSKKKASKKVVNKITKKVAPKSKIIIPPPHKNPIQDPSLPGVDLPKEKLAALSEHFKGVESSLPDEVQYNPADEEEE